jgi:hypothetical protein
MEVSSVEATVPFYGGVIGVACWVEPLTLTVTPSKPSNQSGTDKLRPRFSSVGGEGAIGNAAAYWPWRVSGSLVVGGAKRTLRKDVERGFYLVRFCPE